MDTLNPASPPKRVSWLLSDRPADESDGPDLLLRYQEVRRFTESLCEPLETEDYVIQSMPDVSPAKWHIAHTSWFFETFLLAPNLPGYRSPHLQYNFLFNSYYNAVGDRHCRAVRGLLSRPTVRDTYEYRHYVDEKMEELLRTCTPEEVRTLAPVLTLGLHHEQQHQELILTDIKHVLSVNPLRPAYAAIEENEVKDQPVPPLRWVEFPEGLCEIGFEGEGFCFDNETPRHRVFVERYAVGSRLVTNGEYLAFIDDGGYERPEFWLSAGWATAQEQGWTAPLYWEEAEGEWRQFTLSGIRRVEEAAPVCHVSYFEADAYARWAGARLLTEAEWEFAARDAPRGGNFAEEEQFHPVPLSADDGRALHQIYGDVWEWTRSAYSPYPGYAPHPGALGEYNGKFMCGQFVLRGGSCATSATHIRPTYRNFFPPDARWQFSGIRLAKDL